MWGMLRKLWRDRRGITVVEFALLAPILAFFTAGTIELGRLILLTQKVQNGAYILADLAARDETISEAQLDNMFLALDNVIQPYDVAVLGTAYVTSVGLPDGEMGPVVNWQRQGAGTLDADSGIGSAGGEAVLPEEIVMAEGDTLIVAEVLYAYRPIFGLVTTARTIRRSAYYKPRLGSLETLETS